MKLTIITTGGSIDKDYPRGVGGYAFEITEPAVRRILDQIKPNFKYEIFPLLKKDSLDITDADRDRIFTACKNAPSDKIILTHGTDTLLATAKKLSTIKNKTIILTGAFKPERFKDSDAEFNLGVAMGAVDSLEPGVYISMHGCVYPWNRCGRDEGTGRFVEK